MRHIATELLVDAQEDRARLCALELKLALPLVGFDAVKRDQEVGLPGGAAIFAIGDRLEPGRLLFLDQRLDLAILDRFEPGRSAFSRLPRTLSATERNKLPTWSARKAVCSLRDQSLGFTPHDRGAFAIARIFPYATARGRYFMPQSGATTIRSRTKQAPRGARSWRLDSVREITYAENDDFDGSS
jgi:hypothetical protein